jgi:hypothetical protein
MRFLKAFNFLQDLPQWFRYRLLNLGLQGADFTNFI